jgi:hypothetical protein
MLALFPLSLFPSLSSFSYSENDTVHLRVLSETADLLPILFCSSAVIVCARCAYCFKLVLFGESASWCYLVSQIIKYSILKMHPEQVQCLTPAIPATWETEFGRIIVQGQLGQKVSETLTDKPGWVVRICSPSYVRLPLGKIMIPYLKNN